MRVSEMNQQTSSEQPGHAYEPLCHEALFYDDRDRYIDHAAAFVKDGIDAEEPVLVLAPEENLMAIRDAVGSIGDAVVFGNMEEVGRNPSRIIPVWRNFLEERGRSGVKIRGVGEPVWCGRTSEEIVEAQRHESLINLAFMGTPAWILCPYDTSLGSEVLTEAYRSHPCITQDEVRHWHSEARDLNEIAKPFDDPLPDPPDHYEAHGVALESLEHIRKLVTSRAEESGLSRQRSADMVLAVNEVTTNTIRHGGGTGVMRVWKEPTELVCEVRDGGQILNPMAGRERPVNAAEEGGLGLWLVNQLCDLVQIRSYADGSAVRMHMRRI